jgi:hypothetical protein
MPNKKLFVLFGLCLILCGGNLSLAVDPPGTYIVDTPAEAALLGANGFNNTSIKLVIQTDIPITIDKLVLIAGGVDIEGTAGNPVEIINSFPGSEVYIQADNGSVVIKDADIRARNKLTILSKGTCTSVLISDSIIIASSTLAVDNPPVNPGGGLLDIEAEGVPDPLNPGCGLGNVAAFGSTIWGESKMVMISKNGTVTLDCGCTAAQPGGATLGGFVTLQWGHDNDKPAIYRFGPDGSFIDRTVIAGAENATDLACDGSMLYMLTNHGNKYTVYKLDPASVPPFAVAGISRTLIRKAGGLPVINAYGLAVDGNELWIVGKGDALPPGSSVQRLLRYNLADAFTGTAPLEIAPEFQFGLNLSPPNNKPTGLTIEDGYLYVTDEGNPPRIFRYMRTGSAGEPSKALREESPLTTTVKQPSDLAICGDSVWVVDFENKYDPMHKIYEYSLLDLFPNGVGTFLNAKSAVNIFEVPDPLRPPTSYSDNHPMGLCVLCGTTPSDPRCSHCGGGASEIQLNGELGVDIHGTHLVGYSHLNVFGLNLNAAGAWLELKALNISVDDKVDLTGADVDVSETIRIVAKGTQTVLPAFTILLNNAQLRSMGTQTTGRNPVSFNGTLVNQGTAIIGKGDVGIQAGSTAGSNTGKIDLLNAKIDKDYL